MPLKEKKTKSIKKLNDSDEMLLQENRILRNLMKIKFKSEIRQLKHYIKRNESMTSSKRCKKTVKNYFVSTVEYFKKSKKESMLKIIDIWMNFEFTKIVINFIKNITTL